MRPTSSVIRLSLIAAAVFALAACMPPNIVMRYEPTSAAVPLAMDPRPKLFLERVEDRTNRAPVSFGGIAEWKFDSPIDETLRDALRTEMGRLGIELVGNRGQADAVLSAAWVRGSIGNERGSHYAEVSIALTLKTPKGEELWDNTIWAKSGHHGSIMGKVFSNAFTEALTGAMRQIGPLWESKGVFSKLDAGGAGTPASARAARRTGTPTAAVRSDVDELPRAAAPKRANAYAVVIGLREYRQELPQADFADSDARLFTRYLTQVLGFEEANVATLINDQASKSDFEKYFESWLPDRVENGADVFVYYSGHGAPDPATGETFLVPYDGDPTYLQKTGYSVKRLYTELEKLPAKNLTVVMDSCFSGAGGRSVLAKGARPLVTLTPPAGASDRLSILSAGAGNQVSHGYHDKGHGLFTYFLLKGLKEQVGRGALKWRSVFDLAVPGVAKIARREYSADQIPQWQGPER